MLSKRTIPVILAGIFFLSSCVPNAPATPTLVPATEAPPVKPIAADPFATYENSFEAINDLSASGITSNQNGIPTTSKSAVRINKDIVHSGSQSLEAYGTIGSPAGSTISIDLPVQSLIGKDAVDLSNKMLSVSVFIPKGSPIDKVYFAFSEGDQFTLIPVHVGGDADVKGRWFSDDFNMERFYNSPSERDAYWQDKNKTNNILWNCATISLVGQRSAQGATASASFIVDDLKWADVPYTLDSVPVDKNVDSLRKYADLHNLKIGSLLLDFGNTDYMMDPHYVQTLAQEFNLVSGITTNWESIDKPENPSDLNLDYTGNDDVFKLLAGAQLSQKGATGGWNEQLPKWIFDLDYQSLQPYLESRIEKDMSRYKGNIFIWDVFNETVSDKYAGLRNRQHKGPSVADWVPYGYDYSPWVDGNDTSLIRAAFVKARQVDPNAKLFLNDAFNEITGKPKTEAVYNLVADLKQQGVPLDGVGFQFRYEINNGLVDNIYPKQTIDAFLKNVDKTVKRYADLGVLVEFSEVEVGIRIDDIDFSTPAGKNLYEKRLADQAKVYGGLAKIAVENKNVAAFIIWMVSDRYPQGAVGPGYGDTSLFDPEYKPKPAYYAVLDELKK